MPTARMPMSRPPSKPSTAPASSRLPQRLRRSVWAWLLAALWLAALSHPVSGWPAATALPAWLMQPACAATGCALADHPRQYAQHCASLADPAADHAPDPRTPTDTVDLAVDAPALAPPPPASPPPPRQPLAVRWRSCGPRRRRRPPRIA